MYNAMQREKITYEIAERLRCQVKVHELPSLDVRIISGRSENTGVEIRGTVVLRAVPGAARYWNRHEAGFVWRDDGPPTLTDREFLRDWSGVSNGDPVTWGHLTELGIAKP